MWLLTILLIIDGIPGESEDAGHKDKIAVLSVSWGETQPGS
jgi:type VI protein secretion system component Hcp